MLLSEYKYFAFVKIFWLQCGKSDDFDVPKLKSKYKK